MLTKYQFKALIRYEEGRPINPDNGKLSYIDEELYRDGHIQSHDVSSTFYDTIVTLNHPESYIITDKGRNGLAEYRKEKRSHIIHLIVSYILGFISGIFTSLIATYIGTLIF